MAGGVQLRPRADGGVSECSSPDELVGRGRCCHILDSASNDEKFHVIHVERGRYEVTLNESTVDIASSKEDITKFFQTVSSLDDEQVAKIVGFLEER